MIISATVIRHPRVTRYCEECRNPITGAHLRLYGCADAGDRPYVLRLHLGCCTSRDPKVIAARTAPDGESHDRNGSER